MVQIEEDKLKSLIALLKSKDEIKGLSSDLQGLLQDFEDNLINEVDEHLGGAIVSVADTLIETFVPTQFVGITESLVNPIIEKGAEIIEDFVEDKIKDFSNEG